MKSPRLSKQKKKSPRRLSKQKKKSSRRRLSKQKKKIFKMFDGMYGQKSVGVVGGDLLPSVYTDPSAPVGVVGDLLPSVYTDPSAPVGKELGLEEKGYEKVAPVGKELGLEEEGEKVAPLIYTNKKFKYNKYAKIPGIFASEKMNKGEIIICEQPLYHENKNIYDEEPENIHGKFKNLSPEILKLWKELWSTPFIEKQIKTSLSKFSFGEELTILLSRILTNSFTNKNNEILYYIISRINHNNKPNAKLILPDDPNKFAILYCLKDILQGEEITISYYNPFYSRNNILELHKNSHEIPISYLEGYGDICEENAALYKKLCDQEWSSNPVDQLKEILSGFRSIKKSPIINNTVFTLATKSPVVDFSNGTKKVLVGEEYRELLFNFLYEKLIEVTEVTDTTWFDMFNFFLKEDGTNLNVKENLKFIEKIGMAGNEKMVKYYDLINDAKKRKILLLSECYDREKLSLINDIDEIKKQIFEEDVATKTERESENAKNQLRKQQTIEKVKILKEKKKLEEIERQKLEEIERQKVLDKLIKDEEKIKGKKKPSKK